VSYLSFFSSIFIVNNPPQFNLPGFGTCRIPFVGVSFLNSDYILKNEKWELFSLKSSFNFSNQKMINSPPRVPGSGHNTSEVYYKHPSLIWKNAQLIESTEKEVKIKDNENIILTQLEETLPKVFIY
jgi:hypothetical protein